jgi:hypothetical protein
VRPVAAEAQVVGRAVGPKLYPERPTFRLRVRLRVRLSVHLPVRFPAPPSAGSWREGDDREAVVEDFGEDEQHVGPLQTAARERLGIVFVAQVAAGSYSSGKEGGSPGSTPISVRICPRMLSGVG